MIDTNCNSNRARECDRGNEQEKEARERQERDKSTGERWKRLEKDPVLWYKKRGVFILVYRRVGGVVSRGAVVESDGGIGRRTS
jgi:hypothetical protein